MNWRRNFPILLAVATTVALLTLGQLPSDVASTAPPPPPEQDALPVLPGELPPSNPADWPKPKTEGISEPDTSRDIDFSKPIPRDFTVPIGRASVTIPKGSTWGEGSGDLPGGGYWRVSVIERGKSRIVIDPSTLEIIEVHIDAADADDFRRVIEQVEAQRR